MKSNGKSFKIVSKFYVIYGDGVPIYVGYTNRTVKQRFSEHKHDKDFSDYDSIESIELKDQRLSFDFTWGYNETCRNADKVSKREEYLVNKYCTQDTCYQKAIGGGQTWAFEKWFVKTNKDNPRFTGMSGAKIKARIKKEKNISVDIGNFINNMEPKYQVDIHSFVSIMKPKYQVDISNFVNDMKLRYQVDIGNFVNNMKPQYRVSISDFVNNMKPQHQIDINDFVNDMETQYKIDIHSFVSTMKPKYQVNIGDLIKNMRPQYQISISGFVDSMKPQYKIDIDSFVNNMKWREK